MLESLKAVIFDFDGVVVDSLQTHLVAWQAASSEIFQRSIDDIKKDLAGHATMTISRMICEHFGQTDKISELAERKKELLRLNQHQISLVPGWLEFTNLLKDKKIPFGIASNAPRLFIERTLSSLKLPHPAIVGVEDVQKPKPAPDVFLKCANILGISHLNHKDVAVFEDSTHGISAIISAGMFPIGVTTQHPADHLIAAGVKFTVQNHFESIKKLNL